MMFHRLWKRSRKQDGFTLIELIVVVAILGILAAVLTPRVLDAVENARTSAAEASAKQIQLAMERYLIENNYYPAENNVSDSDELKTALAKYVDIDANAFAVNAYAGYKDTVGDTDEWATNAETAVKFYRLRVTFTEGPVVYVISPNGLEKDGSVTDTDS